MKVKILLQSQRSHDIGFANDIYFGKLRLAWIFAAMSCLSVQFMDTTVREETDTSHTLMQDVTNLCLPLGNSEVLKCVAGFDTACG